MQSAFTSITTQQTKTVALSTVVIFYYAILTISLDITFWEQRLSAYTSLFQVVFTSLLVDTRR